MIPSSVLAWPEKISGLLQDQKDTQITRVVEESEVAVHDSRLLQAEQLLIRAAGIHLDQRVPAPKNPAVDSLLLVPESGL